MSAGKKHRDAAIVVSRKNERDPTIFDVTIRDATGETHHHVTLSRADHERLTSAACPASQCIEAAMRFLLDREPKEAILARFDVSVIARYFPEFDRELPRYIAEGSRNGR